MRYTLLGYNLKNAHELKLDLTDLTILRWFDDFRKSGKMIKKLHEGEAYYWIFYAKINDDIPILYLKKNAIYKRLCALVKKNVLKKIIVKSYGVCAYYAPGENYKYLSPDNTDGDKPRIRRDNCIKLVHDRGPSADEMMTLAYDDVDWGQGPADVEDFCDNFGQLPTDIEDYCDNLGKHPADIESYCDNFGKHPADIESYCDNLGQHPAALNNYHIKPSTPPTYQEPYYNEANTSPTYQEQYYNEANTPPTYSEQHHTETLIHDTDLEQHHTETLTHDTDLNKYHIEPLTHEAYSEQQHTEPPTHDTDLNKHHINPSTPNTDLNNHHTAENTPTIYPDNYPTAPSNEPIDLNQKGTVLNSEQKIINNINTNINNKAKLVRLIPNPTEIAMLMFQKIKSVDIQIAFPRIEDWVSVFEGMIKNDGISPFEIVELIRWIYVPGCPWCYRILDPYTLKAQYAQLVSSKLYDETLHGKQKYIDKFVCGHIYGEVDLTRYEIVQ